MKQYKAYAKVNIFLKITGTRNEYHEILSRFMRVQDLYDLLSFEEKNQESSDTFEIKGSFSCDTQDNTIYKAYQALLQYTDSQKLKNFFARYAVHVEKHIPAFAGLGGGSSDAASFLRMCNETLHLGLAVEELAEIGLRVGADVPFFVYNYTSANVAGIGEIVTPFDEPLATIQTYTPDIAISTPKVYQGYRKDFFHPLDAQEAQKLAAMPSVDVLKSMNAKEANDLFAPALQEYEALASFVKEGYFFSGSGSSFFRTKEN